MQLFHVAFRTGCQEQALGTTRPRLQSERMIWGGGGSNYSKRRPRTSRGGYRQVAFKTAHGTSQAYNLVDLLKTLALPADPIFSLSSRRFAFSCHPRSSVGLRNLSGPLSWGL